MRVLRIISFLVVACLLVSCLAAPPGPSRGLDGERLPTDLDIDPVSRAELMSNPPGRQEDLLLSIGITVFESHSTTAHADAGVAINVLEEVNRNESKYLPYTLRNTLIDSQYWGPVRVLPEEDLSFDLSVSGQIFRSDGLELHLAITARDSAGREWLSKTYRGVASLDDYPDSLQFNAWERFDEHGFRDPFQHVFNQIANDLAEVLLGLSRTERLNIQRIAQLVYANDLSPSAFAGTLQTSASGHLEAVRLLADNDPALQRVNQIQARHEVFIDSVDNYYAALFQEMMPLYVVWRRYSFDELRYKQVVTHSSPARSQQSSANNFASFLDRYERYKWSKIYQQEFAALAEGFNREIAPAVLALNQRVYGLTGSMEEQYQQWREILRKMYELESAW